MQSLLQRLLLGNAGGGGGGNPTLNYNFVDGSAFPSAITFSRGTNATQFDSSGNLVYAPANLLTYSEQFDNAVWGPVAGTVTANATTAPSGAVTADRGVTSGVNFQVIQGATITSGATVSGSVFLKADGINEVELVLLASNNTTPYGRATFNVSTGVISTAASSANGGTNVSASITAINNGWYRCVVTVTYPATTSAGMRIYAQGATGGIFLWGAQLNPTPVLGGVTGSLSTYYPTTASAYYGPRLDYDPVTLAAQGLLIEEQRTNSIRNNTMQGAVAGTPGTAPTNWAVSTGAGITRELVGTGTENGITYIDYRFTGTGSVNSDTQFESSTQIASVSGQTWAHAAYVKLQAGSLTNVTVTQIISELSNVGGFLAASTQNITPTAAGLATQRYSFNRTLNNASTAYVVALLRLTSAGAIDITLRIGLPQLEQGAFATSVIPTTTTALTRSADVASVNTLSPWYNATEGTLFAEMQKLAVETAGFPRVACFDDGGFNNSIQVLWNNSVSRFYGNVQVGGTTQADLGANGTTQTNVNKIAFGYQINNFAASVNGAAAIPDVSGTIPSGISIFRLGRSSGGSDTISGYLRRVTYYPVRLTNAALQQITT